MTAALSLLAIGAVFYWLVGRIQRRKSPDNDTPSPGGGGTKPPTRPK